MGTVVLHAGMGKAGSSSVQAWLAENANRLRKLQIGVLVARAEEKGAGIQLDECRPGRINSDAVVDSYSEASDKRAVVENVLEQLGAAATRHRLAVLTGGAMELFFWRGDEDFLSGLDDLARNHEVRVAYYVRPQHTALEAHWRQWGFRSGSTPSQYLATRSRALHYFDTYASVRRYAPSVSFEPRPFRRDLLDGGDPATDFARSFLGLADTSAVDSIWSNPGLSLEVVNALSYAPPGLFWSSIHDNGRIPMIKKVLARSDAVEHEETTRSRALLHDYCYKRFEAGNSGLIDAMGWETDSFVPPPEDHDDGDEPCLTALDELWRPKASEAELKVLYSALDHSISQLVRERAPNGYATPSRPTARRARLRRLRRRLGSRRRGGNS